MSGLLKAGMADYLLPPTADKLFTNQDDSGLWVLIS